LYVQENNFACEWRQLWKKMWITVDNRMKMIMFALLSKETNL